MLCVACAEGQSNLSAYCGEAQATCTGASSAVYPSKATVHAVRRHLLDLVVLQQCGHDCLNVAAAVHGRQVRLERGLALSQRFARHNAGNGGGGQLLRFPLLRRLLDAEMLTLLEL